jgi:hypothetical protein
MCIKLTWTLTSSIFFVVFIVYPSHTSADRCGEGLYAAFDEAVGDEICTLCPSYSGIICHTCVYPFCQCSDWDSEDVCLTCSANSPAGSVSASDCTSCLKAETCEVGWRTEDFNCPDGFISQFGSGPCLAVKADVVPIDGMCPPGYNNKGDSCSPCAESTYSDSPMNAGQDCSKCPRYAGVICETCTYPFCQCEAYDNNGLCSQCAANSPAGSTSAGACASCMRAEVCEEPCETGTTGPDGGPCTTCVSGKYKSASGSAACSNCPTSSNSPITSTAITACVCNPGFTGQDGDTCTACVSGKYKSASGSMTCSDCPAGTYSATTGATDPTMTSCECDAGTTGPSNGPCNPCAVGQYKATPGSAACSTCEQGTVAVTTAATACVAAAYNGNAITTGCAQQTACEAGCVNTLADGTCYQCGEGYYKNGTAAGEECTPCWRENSGQLCTRCTNWMSCYCDPGYTGENTIGACSACAAGTYKQSSGSAACLGCPAGKTSSSAARQCDCPAGHFARITNDTCTACPAGTTSPSGSTDAAACVNCPDGYISQSGSVCVCPPGYQDKEPGCFLCEEGKYSDGGAVQTCTSCPTYTGTICHTCVDTGVDAFCLCYGYDNGLCSQCRTKSPSGSSALAACTCPAGTTGPDIGPCNACAAGQYKATSGSAVCSTCAQGTVALTTGASTCTSCGAGTFSETLGASTCYICAAGTYSNSTASSSCLGCPASTFALTGSSTCTSCPSNSHTAIQFKTKLTDCKCNIGYSGPSGGPCTACAAGEYDTCRDDPSYNSPGYPDCAQHQKNFDNSGTRSCVYFEICSQCCKSCAEECDRINRCSNCSTGFYSNAGASTCPLCAIGYSGANCSACAAGKYKGTTGSGVCIQCAAGTASAAASAKCTACVAGKYKGTTGSGACTQCAGGTASAAAGATSSSICIDCGVGKYSALDGASCVPCHGNSSAPARSSAASACVCDIGYQGGVA